NHHGDGRAAPALERGDPPREEQGEGRSDIQHRGGQGASELTLRIGRRRRSSLQPGTAVGGGGRGKEGVCGDGSGSGPDPDACEGTFQTSRVLGLGLLVPRPVALAASLL
ncbi:hypothetical protein THAOC_08639, partial [Thalassiosira oceanica]